MPGGYGKKNLTGVIREIFMTNNINSVFFILNNFYYLSCKMKIRNFRLGE